MVVLAKDAIIEQRNLGNILIEPFTPENVKNSSYDVTLGKWYWKEKKIPPPMFSESPPYRYSDLGTVSSTALCLGSNFVDLTHKVSVSIESSQKVLNPYSEASVRSMWEGPLEALPLEEDIPGIKRGTRIILLEPGENILGHTVEFVGTTDLKHTTMMKTRSSWGRNQITMCRCAGWGDIGFANRYVLEITNNSKYRTVILAVGSRVAQIVFLETSGLKSEGDSYYTTGKYQDKDLKKRTYAELESLWSPEMMIPKLWLDNH